MKESEINRNQFDYYKKTTDPIRVFAYQYTTKMSLPATNKGKYKQWNVIYWRAYNEKDE